MAKIPIKSNLNVDNWKKYLVNYPNRNLMDYIQFGFLVSLYERERLDVKYVKNHFSALTYPKEIDKYFKTELDRGTIIVHTLFASFNEHFINLSLTFGLTHGTSMFMMASDAITYIMSEKGYKVFNYIDDYIIVENEDKATIAYETLQRIITELGLPINAKKLIPPGKRVTCMGITIDIEQKKH